MSDSSASPLPLLSPSHSPSPDYNPLQATSLSPHLKSSSRIHFQSSIFPPRPHTPKSRRPSPLLVPSSTLNPTKKSIKEVSQSVSQSIPPTASNNSIRKSHTTPSHTILAFFSPNTST